MDYKYIEQLLERYWECETSLEEENILRSFFAQKEVPANLRPYQEIFAAEMEHKEPKLSDDFDQRVLALIEDVKEEKTVKARTINMQARFSPLYKAAAMVAIVLCLGMAAQQGFNQSANEEMIAEGNGVDTIYNEAEMPSVVDQAAAILNIQATDSLAGTLSTAAEADKAN